MEALTGATAAGEEGKGLFTGRRILIAEDNGITAEIILRNPAYVRYNN